MDQMRNENGSQDVEYIGVGNFVLEIVKIVLLAFFVIVPIRVFLFQPFFVQGASMEPNFEDGEYLIVNEFGYKDTSIGIGDSHFFTINHFKTVDRDRVVVFRYPLDPSKYFIKRVIGLPGEKIEIRNGHVTISNKEHPDGFVLDESKYLPKGLATSGDIVTTLKDNEYFVLGDNRPYSSDSRIWGAVPENLVVGEVLLRAWPLDRLNFY